MKTGHFIVIMAVITLGTIAFAIIRFFASPGLFGATATGSNYTMDFAEQRANDSTHVLATLTFKLDGQFNLQANSTPDSLNFTSTYGIGDSTIHLDSIPVLLQSNELQIHLKTENSLPTAYLFQLSAAGSVLPNVMVFKSTQAPYYFEMFGVGKPMPRRYKAEGF